MHKTIALVVTLLLILVAPAFAEKPAPPEHLTKMFAEVVELEDAVVDADWSQAQKGRIINGWCTK